MFFNIVELKIFLQDIEYTLLKNQSLRDKHKKYTKSIILETPMSQLRFVVSYNDLILLKDLVERTSFDIELSSMLHEIL